MLRILLVEDQAELASRIRAALMVAGWMTMHAACAREALRLVEITPPDLAIVDIDLPAGEGLELIARLRWKARGLKVIAICRERKSLRRRLVAWNCGASRIVTEPESKDLVSAVVDVAAQ